MTPNPDWAASEASLASAKAQADSIKEAAEQEPPPTEAQKLLAARHRRALQEQADAKALADARTGRPPEEEK